MSVTQDNEKRKTKAAAERNPSEHATEAPPGLGAGGARPNPSELAHVAPPGLGAVGARPNPSEHATIAPPGLGAVGARPNPSEPAHVAPPGLGAEEPNPSELAHVAPPGLGAGGAHVLSFTPAAIRQLKHLRAKKGDESLGVRVGVKGGGCSGLSYFLNFQESPKETDLIIEIEPADSAGPIENGKSKIENPLRAWIDPKSARFIAGTTVDFSLSNFLEGGFKFTNPNAAKSCGCGTSFTPKGKE